jgi:phenylacetate-coenzyme A ligase PaaK-like adenylate-forming protein
VGLRRRAGRPVRLWWAPPGVRAAWATCEADQLHTWPEHEHLEVVDDDGLPAESGRLVWSAVGWRGSVWLRVALGPEGRVDRSACSCGRTTPRVRGAARARRPPEPATGSRP